MLAGRSGNVAKMKKSRYFLEQTDEYEEKVNGQNWHPFKQGQVMT